MATEASCDQQEDDTADREWRQEGEWRQYGARSESLGPFLKGLGVPGFAVFLVDALSTDLTISVTGRQLEVIDKTTFGANTTSVTLGADELERSTKTGRKKFMISAYELPPQQLVVQCRLFQRGEGWFTRQTWAVDSDGFLVEKMQLVRPDEEDVTVVRTYRRLRSSTAAAHNIPMLDCEVADNDRMMWMALAGATVGLAGLVWCFTGSSSPGGTDSREQ